MVVVIYNQIKDKRFLLNPPQVYCCHCAARIFFNAETQCRGEKLQFPATPFSAVNAKVSYLFY